MLTQSVHGGQISLEETCRQFEKYGEFFLPEELDEEEEQQSAEQDEEEQQSAEQDEEEQQSAEQEEEQQEAEQQEAEQQEAEQQPAEQEKVARQPQQGAEQQQNEDQMQEENDESEEAEEWSQGSKGGAIIFFDGDDDEDWPFQLPQRANNSMPVQQLPGNIERDEPLEGIPFISRPKDVRSAVLQVPQVQPQPEPQAPQVPQLLEQDLEILLRPPNADHVEQLPPNEPVQVVPRPQVPAPFPPMEPVHNHQLQRVHGEELGDGDNINKGRLL